MESKQVKVNAAHIDSVLQLENITLVCVESRFLELAEWSLKKSLQQIKPKKTYLFTSPQSASSRVDPRITLVSLAEYGSIEAYNRFILRELHRYIETDYVLITQWDSFVYESDLWSSQFLECDYIGAPWPHHPDFPVGNGGFSLRSRRLLQITAGLDFLVRSFKEPEDAIICHSNCDYLKGRSIRIADLELATRFSFESAADNSDTKPRTFGFHGVWNFPSVLPLEDLKQILTLVPGTLLKEKNGYLFLVQLLKLGQRRLFLTSLLRRIGAGGINYETIKLAIQFFSKKRVSKN